MNTIVNGIKLFLVGLLGIGVLSVAFVPSTAYAQGSGGCGDTRLLTFPAWYNGLTTGADCSDIKSPEEAGGISPFIWKIVLNLIEIILNLVGYASVGFIIYGGYKYMISAGSPDGMVAARKTIMNAVIGLIISIAAVAIVRIIPEVV